MLTGFLYDFRDAARSIVRDRAFSITAALLLGIGIGACTLLFSLFDALVLRPLPVPEPDSIVRLIKIRPRLPTVSDFSRVEYETIRDHSTTLRSLAAAFQMNVGYTDEQTPVRARLQGVSNTFFTVFATGAHLGRMLAPDQQRPDSTLPAVLSYNFWRDHYGADPSVIGRKVLIQNHPFTIAGVTAKGFNGASVESCPDVWVSLRTLSLFFKEQDRLYMSHEIYARLRPGVSIERARDETYALYRTAMENEATTRTDKKTELLVAGEFRLQRIPNGVSPLRDQITPALTFLMIAVGVLLLMVATNVSGLLFARLAGRSREFAVRLAVGASPAHLLRMALFTGLLLATAGTAAAIAVTATFAPVLPSLLPRVRLLDTTTVPLALTIAISWRVLAFSAGLCILTTLIVSCAPALHAARSTIEGTLRSSRLPANRRGRSLVVLLQICLCTALLITATELAKTLSHLRGLNPGFDTERVVTFALDPSLASGDARQMIAAILRAKEEIKNLPGVLCAALSSRPLLHGSGFKITVAAVGQRTPRSDFMNVSTHAVTPDYFDTIGLRFVSGRNYSPSEFLASSSQRSGIRPVVVNQAFVNRFFPESAGAGNKFGFGVEVIAKPEREIIGVVTNAKYRSLREPWQPTIYGPYAPGDSPGPAMLHVRTAGPASAVIQPVRDLLHRLAPSVPIYEVSTLKEDVEASVATEKLLAGLGTAFSAIATVIVAAGLFAALSFIVTRRTREIAIRVAVGADRADIVRLVAGQMMMLANAGVACGIAFSQAAGRFIGSLLYEVAPADAGSVGGATLLMMAVAVTSTAVPIIRAIRIEPASALRDE